MVYVFLTTGFELVEAMTPIDLLRRANIDVTTVSITGDLAVESSSGVRVQADMLVADCDFEAEVLVLPGGPGTQGYMDCQPLLDALLAQHEAGKWIAAICAAPGILAQIGIHVKSTIYPTLKDQIQTYTKTSVWVDKNVITGNAVGAVLDFSMVIIAYVKGIDSAKEVASSIVYALD